MIVGVLYRGWLNDLELSCCEANELGALRQGDLLITSVDDHLLAWHGLGDHLCAGRENDLLPLRRWGRLGRNLLDQLTPIRGL